jgi:hypothetical protein
MLPFPSGYLQMESIEEMGYPRWNLQKNWATLDGIHTEAHLRAAVYIGLPPDGVYSIGH